MYRVDTLVVGVAVAARVEAWEEGTEEGGLVACELFSLPLVAVPGTFDYEARIVVYSFAYKRFFCNEERSLVWDGAVVLEVWGLACCLAGDGS